MKEDEGAQEETADLVLLNAELLFETGNVGVVDVGTVEVLEEEGESSETDDGDLKKMRKAIPIGKSAKQASEPRQRRKETYIKLPNQGSFLWRHSSWVPRVGMSADREHVSKLTETKASWISRPVPRGRG
jgi:hypothetical protein